MKWVVYEVHGWFQCIDEKNWNKYLMDIRRRNVGTNLREVTRVDDQGLGEQMCKLANGDKDDE